MKLTKEQNDKIKKYFEDIDPNKLVENLIENFGFVEIQKNYPKGSHVPKQSYILSERLKQQNQPTKASDLSKFKNKSPK